MTVIFFKQLSPIRKNFRHCRGNASSPPVQPGLLHCSTNARRIQLDLGKEGSPGFCPPSPHGVRRPPGERENHPLMFGIFYQTQNHLRPGLPWQFTNLFGTAESVLANEVSGGSVHSSLERGQAPTEDRAALTGCLPCCGLSVSSFWFPKRRSFFLRLFAAFGGNVKEEKKMNGLLMMAIAIAVLGGGYLIYGRWLAKTWGVDPQRKNPRL